MQSFTFGQPTLQRGLSAIAELLVAVLEVKRACCIYRVRGLLFILHEKDYCKDSIDGGRDVDSDMSDKECASLRHLINFR